jgi:hypothetical protein
MDQEIAFAEAAKLDCFVFLRYKAVNPTMDAALAFFKTSTAKTTLKWAAMDQVSGLGTTGSFTAARDALVADFQRADYQKIQTTRPLFYLYYSAAEVATYRTNDTNLKAMLDSLRTAAQGVGLGNPYIVVLQGGGASVVEATRVALGAEAIGTYTSDVPATLEANYSDLATSAAAYWDTLAAASAGKVVPTAMTGWDQRSRYQRPPNWITNKAFVGLRRYVKAATDAELGSHIAAAQTWADTNGKGAGAVLVYSWNEFSEGHRPLCPTRGNPTGTHLAVIKTALGR